MLELVQSFIDFAAGSPTAFHSVASISNILNQVGFHSLKEQDAWKLEPGERYYVTRNQSSLIAFTVPEEQASHFQIVASHTDSPMFKLKPDYASLSCSHYLRLNVEGYGGMIMSTWMDRPLSIAGRMVIRNNDTITSQLVNLEKDTVLIPNMPIHFNREVNSGYSFNPQIDLLPLYGDAEDKEKLNNDIADHLGVSPDQLISGDLFLYSRVPGSIWGSQKQFFSCGRIDDLECVYTSLQAFIQAGIPAHFIPVFAVFDNEEVGSLSKQGAGSTFLADILWRTVQALSSNALDYSLMISRSFMVSADNAHAVHPNHPEQFDEQNRTYMNEGIVIKHNSRQKYTTDAVSDGIFSILCERIGVPIQRFSNRSDIPGGSTLGTIANTQVSLNTVDIGLPQLAMHSSYETAGCKDLPFMIDALRAFYTTQIVITSDGCFSLQGI